MGMTDLTDKELAEIRACFEKYRQIGAPQVKALFAHIDRQAAEIAKWRKRANDWARANQGLRGELEEVAIEVSGAKINKVVGHD